MLTRLAITIVTFFVLFWSPRFVGTVAGTIDGDNNNNNKNLDIGKLTIVPGPPDRPAIVMLTDGSSKLNKFQTESINDKVDYAKHHNYTLICGRSSLDKYRSTTWSKLKLIHRVLSQTTHSMIFWLDVDTIIWDRQRTIESFLPSDSQVSMVAQLDLHRSMESKYFNAGVLLIRKTDWIMNILRQAYRQWQIPIFQGLFYFDADQDAMNLAMAKSDVAAASRDGGSGKGSTAGRLDDHLDLKRYGQLWTLGKDRNQKPFVLHFPNCVNGRCAPEYLRLYRETMDIEV